MKTERKRILLVEDDDSLRRVLEYQLDEAGYAVDGVAHVARAQQALAETDYSLLVVDLQLEDGSGLDVLKTCAGMSGPPTILMTAYATVESAVEALKLGAFDYLLKPFSKDQLLIAAGKALRYATLVEDNRRLRSLVENSGEGPDIIGQSSAMRELMRDARQVAVSDATILITGESGTGKELLARAVHLASLRRAAPFIAISCGAVPENLLESEFFGFKKGAFTGAVTDKRGKLEEADGGTAFFDEIGDMQPSLQVKILRLLQEKEIQKIGEARPRKVDVRIVAATNRNLAKMVEEGEFREDLYYRLAVIPLRVPTLRERREDIPLLVDHFLRASASRTARPQPLLDPAALDVLESYGWPGNVRELQNHIERLVVMNRTGRIVAEDLPERMRGGTAASGPVRFELPESDFSFEELEKELLMRALEKHHWNQTRTARYLGFTRSTLQYRMQKFGLQRSE